ncbi:hypothetical protein GCM10023196_014330 [Actinoallomurus vinaceus]|uniref:Uncharacterized protein n=1 Tax=Actinoallomurus vinaceus TaxID=1080074 RepID=A0ABP8U2I7_9ACTN
MTTPLTDGHATENDPPPDTPAEDQEPYVRLPVDASEPMASWLAII